MLLRSYSMDGCASQVLYSRQGKIVADWQKLQDIIGISFNDMSLLQQAFVHTSYTNENPDFSLAHLWKNTEAIASSPSREELE